MSDQNQQPAGDNNQPQGGGGAASVQSTGAAMEDKVVRIGDYNVKVVRKDCIGAATCVAVSPNVFELDSQNIAVIKDGAQDTPENIVAAAQGCPTKAIIVTNANTGEQVWPK